jgi:thiamine-phosphate pyrophosphorylase
MTQRRTLLKQFSTTTFLNIALKKLFTKNRQLYLITDRAVSGLSLPKIASYAITAGARIIQMREKNMAKKEIYTEAVALRAITLKQSVTFIINDYVDIALAVNADGVHLGQDDLPVAEARKMLGKNKIIGVSTHSLKQAINAERAGADYIGFGPIFRTATKDAGHPKGAESLKEIKRCIKIPVAAIGGITAENAAEALRFGADAVAVISGILRGDIKANIKKFLFAIKH